MLIPFAIQVMSPNSIGKRKLQARKIYYFLDGFKIVDNSSINIESYRLKKESLYQDYFRTENKPDISISAIVGGNGSGKSSIIEFFMRLVNNFAATTIGEYETNPGAQHLHYINGIDGEFYYLLDEIPYCLKVRNRHVLLMEYKHFPQVKSDQTIEYILGDTIYDNQQNDEPKSKDTEYLPMLKWGHSKGIGLSRVHYNGLKDLYQHIFYSYVSNYSIYAYNTYDFSTECNSNAYEGIIRKIKNKEFDCEHKSWLNGIFHKNDGYQTPIVLTPYRTRGNININTENILSKERLLVLLIQPDSQFRIINQHLKAEKLVLELKKAYDFKTLKQKVHMPRLYTKGYDLLTNYIIRFWSEYIHVDLNRFSSICPCFETATRYLVYKTLKISETYSQYHFFYEKNANKTYKIDLNGLDDLVRMLSLDYSHITKKIRQILAYIIYGTYRVDSTVGDFNIDDISNGTKEVLNKNLKDVQYGKCGIHLTIDDLVPPPIFDVKIQLSDMRSSAPVLFETLSSGERQQVYSISAFLYHLTNLESVWQDSNNCRIVYQHINVVFEEIELYFHPELQRTYIKNILDGIKQINIPHIKSINMCFVTHSPFILSDIPNRNILALKNDDDNNFIENRLSTFGANIHDMLKNSFFLENGPMGAYADYVIREIISEMDRAKEGESHSSATIIHDKIILIDEPIVRMALLDEYHRIFPHENVQERIDELKVQIKELENRL